MATNSVMHLPATFSKLDQLIKRRAATNLGLLMKRIQLQGLCLGWKSQEKQL
ncbi:hypothetical protein Hsw_1206 [Hymenobacter swuensis DY53]|uniref:Uncharacterized protein n=1 Tax=Hymenobacter swuensis DY53 TaxID=1227739 RepID=W8F2I8_9BACT|nr:hypothetical protein Hsw_1206 [Hymenobacter swuensis DY53]